MIKVTQEMREALKRKLQPTPLEPTMDDALEAVLEIIDRDYVSRYGTVSVTVPTELLGGQPETMEHARNSALDRAKLMEYAQNLAIERANLMGGTIEDIETFEREPHPFKFNDSTILTWRMRRD